MTVEACPGVEKGSVLRICEGGCGVQRRVMGSQLGRPPWQCEALSWLWVPASLGLGTCGHLEEPDLHRGRGFCLAEPGL